MTMLDGHVSAAGHHGDQAAVEISLNQEVLAVICRRGRRRLRDLQTSCQASLKLDRARSVLQVRGSHDAIKDVQRQLQMLTGPSVSVSPAVWAELMRTRTTAESSEAAVAMIQQECGCRIHIERSAQQIRLFGPQDVTVSAQHLLEILDDMCGEESVMMECPLHLDMDMLQTFAQEFGVTLQVEDKQITVLGIKGAVAEAAQELRKYESDNKLLERGCEAATPSDAAHSAILAAMAKLKVSEDGAESTNVSSPGTTFTHTDTGDSGEGNGSPPRGLMQGVVISKMPPASSPATNPQHESQINHSGGYSAYGSSANFCVHCGKRAEKIAGIGTPKFCIYCGQPMATGADSTHSDSGNSGHVYVKPHKPHNGFSYANQMPVMPMQQFLPSPQYGNQMMPPGMVMLVPMAGAANGLQQRMVDPNRWVPPHTMPMGYAMPTYE